MSDPVTRQEQLLSSIATGGDIISPVTREEMYLAYMAGDTSVVLPEPVTRKEHFLYQACLNEGSGGEENTILENVQIELDLSGGNQNIDAGEGRLIKSAVILKPDTLTPENIRKDVNVAGIVGAHEGGEIGEQPQLFAPSISIVEDLMTITNPESNGDFVTAFGGYVNGEYSGIDIPSSQTTIDLTEIGMVADDYTISVTCKGENFKESTNSNSVDYTNIFYNVESVLVGCQSDNPNVTVRKGHNYSSNVIAPSGFTMVGADVTVKMGGVDITSTAYVFENPIGIITIENVTADLEISITAKTESVSFTKKYSNSYGLETISTDGVDIYSLYEDNNYFYLVSGINNGQSWGYNKLVSFYPRHLCANNGTVYAGNGSLIKYTTDRGATINSTNSKSHNILSCIDGELYSVFIYSSNAVNVFKTSDNASTWETVSNNLDSASISPSSCVGKEFGKIGDIYYSTGESSTVIGKKFTSFSKKSFRANGIVLCNDKYVAMDYKGNVYTSNDGLNWSGIKTTLDNETGTWNGLVYNGQLLFAIRSDGKYAYSKDGTEWNYSNMPTGGTTFIKVVVLNDGTFVVLENNGIYVSN